MLVMFDLPTDTKSQRKAANDFRHFLLDEGFERSQYSIYVRFFSGKEAFSAKVGKIETVLPDWGDIQILQFTDKQYETVIRFRGRGRCEPNKNPNQMVLF